VLCLVQETLLELYRSCADNPDFVELDTLRATAASEMVDMAEADSGRTVLSLWAKVFRIKPETAVKRARDAARAWWGQRWSR
jgi:hypothetical protein